MNESEKPLESGPDATWSEVWNRSDLSKLRESLALERRSWRWRMCRKILENRYGSLSGLNCLEIGAGVGMFSYLLAEEGASITLLDDCAKALEQAVHLHAGHGHTLRTIQADALTHEPDEEYNLVVSLGLAEHFDGDDRLAIVNSHLRLAASGGTIMFSVPNLHCGPYRRWKKRLERENRWEFGFERPFTRAELERLCVQAGMRDIRIFGSPYLEDLDRYSLHKIISRLLGSAQFRLSMIDDRYGGCLVAVGMREYSPASHGRGNGFRET